MAQKIIVGTRGSKLAMVQTELVAARLRAANPGIEVSISRIVTKGDTNHNAPLELVAGEGIFVKELEEALLEGQIDLAVHSLKDMPTQLPKGLCLSAVMERVNPGDVLVTKGQKLAELPSGASIGTGSLRRAAQLTAYRPDLKVVSIRGNVDTRLGKVTSGELDGVILAAAGLNRLGWEDRITEYLPIEHFLPAVGQGVLAIEGRSDEKGCSKIAAPLNHLPTWQSITAERAFLRTLAGGCQAPIAALG
ncbi:MAG: hydroxymethylbilane synthase, partial [Chloroflexota bacterium]